MDHIRSKRTSLLDQVGGLPVLQRVHKIFYDKVYAHPWIGQYFAGHDQVAIENRQTSFMAEKMGGPAGYMGKPMDLTHEHMYISEELFDLRKQLFKESLEEVGLDPELIERWLKIDGAFKRHIVKEDEADFMQTDLGYRPHVVHEKPET